MSIGEWMLFVGLVVLMLVALAILWWAEPRNKDLNP